MKIVLSLMLLFYSFSEAQILKGGYKSSLNDTSTYFIRLSSENPFTIDSVQSVFSGRRLDFFNAENPSKSCTSVVCSDTGEVVIGFRELQSMRPLQNEKRTKLNSQMQPTQDYQKGVVVYTRHGKKFRRIAVNTFMEVPPGNPNLLPSVIRPNPSK